MNILQVNGNVYELSDTMKKAVIKMAQDKFKGQNAIVAVEKDGVVEMKRDVFVNNQNFNRKIMEYNKAGFLVHYTRKGRA